MDKTDILTDLGTQFDLPVTALEAAREQLAALAPSFIDLVERAARGEQLSEQDSQRMFFGVHLLGEAEDQRLYRPLTNLLTNAPYVAAEEFGDGIVETGPGILINVADSDPEPLLKLARQTDIEYPTGDVLRSLAVGAYAYLVAVGRFDSAQAESNLAAIGETFDADIDMSTAHAWLTAAAALGLSDLVARGRQMMQDDPTGAPIFTVEEVDELAARAQGRTAEAVIAEGGFEPFHDTIATMSGWYAFSQEGVGERIDALAARFIDGDADLADPLLLEAGETDPTDFSDEADEGWEPRPVGPPQPAQQVNPYRNVGRNDPCPCGSGKKYKKCCLS